MRIFSIIIIFLLASKAHAEWLSIEKLDYSVNRPLVIESRYLNGYRFDIIRPKDVNKEIVGDNELQMIAEHYQDNLLLIRKITHDHDFPIVLSENTIGWFSFYPANKIIKNIGENENGYFAIKEWSGGSVVTFHLYITNSKLKKIKEITTKNDLMFEK